LEYICHKNQRISTHFVLKNIIFQHPVALRYHCYILSTPSILQLGRPRRRWVDNIKMDLGEKGWEGMDWIDLVQDRDQWRALLNTVTNLRVP
jgi:hypothetical protein